MKYVRSQNKFYMKVKNTNFSVTRINIWIQINGQLHTRRLQISQFHWNIRKRMTKWEKCSFNQLLTQIGISLILSNQINNHSESFYIFLEHFSYFKKVSLQNNTDLHLKDLSNYSSNSSYKYQQKWISVTSIQLLYDFPNIWIYTFLAAFRCYHFCSLDL